MVTGNPLPLKVDPEQLSAAGGAMLSAAEQLPEAPPPFMPVGSDPLSAAIIGQIPAVETPIMTQLPLVRTQSADTAKSVVDSALAYRATDQQSGVAINEMMQNLPPASGQGLSGSSSPASAAGGGADSMGQMMSMPMQMASQMGQMPMQMMGAVAAVPQGVIQGAQQVGQQVQQVAGQFGQGGGAEGGATQTPGAEIPELETAGQEDGAAPGQPEAERAPDAKDNGDESDSPTTPPGRHRAEEPDDGINL